MSKSRTLMTILFAFIAQMMMAQGKVISGTVEDAMGPIMMANVVERDGNNRIVSATQTDMMGKALEKWNVSNGNDFRSMFSKCSSLSDIKPLEKWKLSKSLLKNIT